MTARGIGRAGSLGSGSLNAVGGFMQSTNPAAAGAFLGNFHPNVPNLPGVGGFGGLGLSTPAGFAPMPPSVAIAPVIAPPIAAGVAVAAPIPPAPPVPPAPIAGIPPIPPGPPGPPGPVGPPGARAPPSSPVPPGSPSPSNNGGNNPIDPPDYTDTDPLATYTESGTDHVSTVTVTSLSTHPSPSPVDPADPLSQDESDRPSIDPSPGRQEDIPLPDDPEYPEPETEEGESTPSTLLPLRSRRQQLQQGRPSGNTSGDAPATSAVEQVNATGQDPPERVLKRGLIRDDDHRVDCDRPGALARTPARRPGVCKPRPHVSLRPLERSLANVRRGFAECKEQLQTVLQELNQQNFRNGS